ncbi:MAG: M28 family peptidase, partial [Phycisphaerales bacterium]|nr:M28 family peptidase [Phycisphaerales bacterium]
MHLRRSFLPRFAMVAVCGLGLSALAQQPAADLHAGAVDGATASAPRGYKPAVNDSDVHRYREHVVTLANPYFEGRGSGTAGNDRAAAYLELWFERIGLEPIFEGSASDDAAGTSGKIYRQEFSVGTRTEVTSASLGRVGGGDGGTELRSGDDFEVLGLSGSGKGELPLVFAGYAISEAELPGGGAYQTFAEGDSLEGKAAIILRFEPMNADGKSRFADERWSNNADLGGKIRLAASKGAAAVILVNAPGADDDRARTDKLETASSLRGMGRALDIPVVMMTIGQADILVRAADEQGRSLESLRKIADEAGGVIELPKAKLAINVAVERKPRITNNIIGLLPGKGELADEYVVIGAHFDHVGDGNSGGSVSNEYGQIHYGADDNASGTSGMLLAAEIMKKHYEALPAEASARSILFMGFSGEEMGLIGSRFFVQNSPFEASSIYAMLNMDMIGRMRDDKIEIGGIGSAEGFEAIVDPFFTASGLEISRQPGGSGPSDHASFNAGGIPVLFFFTGFHREYHTPRDVSALINPEGGVRVAMLCTDIAKSLAARTEPLTFVSTSGSSSGPRLGRGDPAPLAAMSEPA